MDWIRIESPGWAMSGVARPRTFSERWRGMRSLHGAMLFRATSVHGIGMDRTLIVVDIDRVGLVLGTRKLEPGAVLWSRNAWWMLELETHVRSPAVGGRVWFYDLADGGPTRDMRDADRKPRRRLRTARRDTPVR